MAKPPGNDSDADAPDSPDTPGADGGGDPDSGGTPTKWQTISLGGTHACALTIDGRAYCWGFRSDGNCGDGQAAILTGADSERFELRRCRGRQ